MKPLQHTKNRKGTGTRKKNSEPQKNSPKKSTIVQSLRTFYNSKPITWIRNSFAFALVKAIIAVIILLLLIYLIQPEYAHIYLNFEKSEVSNYASSSIILDAMTAKCSGFVDDSFYVYTDSSEAEIVIDGYVSINGIHDPNEKIVLRSVNSANNQWVGFTLIGKCESITLWDNVHAYVDNLSSLSAKEMNFRNTDEMIFVPSEAEVYIENSKDPNMNRKIDPIDNEIQIGSNYIYEIRITTRNTPKKDLQILLKCDSIEAPALYDFSGQVTGKATVAYSSTNNEFNLNAQDVSLINNANKELSIVLNPTTYEGTLSGYFTEGSISTFSVFPTIQSWFFSTALMAPTTLITVILSAISIFKKSKKKDEES